MKKSNRIENRLFVAEVQKYYRETNITKQAILRKFRISELELMAIMKIDLTQTYTQLPKVDK